MTVGAEGSGGSLRDLSEVTQQGGVIHGRRRGDTQLSLLFPITPVHHLALHPSLLVVSISSGPSRIGPARERTDGFEVERSMGFS